LWLGRLWGCEIWHGPGFPSVRVLADNIGPYGKPSL